MRGRTSCRWVRARSTPSRVVSGAPDLHGNVGKDPLFPDEDTSKDTSFSVAWKVAVTNDGVSIPKESEKAKN